MCARNERSRKSSASSSSKTGGDPAAEKKSSGHRRSSSRTRSSSRQRSSSRARSVRRRRSTVDSGDDKRRRSRSASTRRTSSSRASAQTPKKEYDTPFDTKGRCHHHPNMQLARKKLTGGWKVLIDNCPKCMEDVYTKDSSDNRSVASRRSTTRSKSPHRVGGGDHKSSSKSVGGGCDNRSVSSRRSNRSTRSSRSKILPLIVTNKNEESHHPYDGKGYCHQHSNVRLAKKKFTGGWKILLDRCTECVADDKADSKSVCSKSSRRSRSKSVCSRSSRHDDKRRQSRRLSDTTSPSGDMAASNSSNIKKKSVKKTSYTDDTGKEGFYTGYVNEQHKPHGRGKIEYKDGSKYSGTWMEGSKVHGKTADKKHRKKEGEENVKQVSKGELEDDSDGFERQWEKERRKAKHSSTKVDQGKDRRNGAMEEYTNLFNTSAKVVKDLPFIDLDGDAGKYTGEVNDKLLPHGQGSLTYNHGLIQEGNWTNGFVDDDSLFVC